MTGLLVKLFIKNGHKTDDPNVRKSYGTLSSIVGITVNLILAAIKLFAGLCSGAMAIIADAFNNLSDSGAALITLLSFKVSSKPADKEHPYGHARMEYICSMVVSLIIMLVGAELFISSGEALLGLSEKGTTEIELISLIILAIAIVFKLWLGFFYNKIAKVINSTVIKASAADSFSDSLSTLAVLISSIVIKLTGWTVIDSIVGIAVSVMIVIAGFKILNETKDILLGSAPIEETVEQIKSIISDYPDILDIHDLMVHNYGPGSSIASLHAEVDGKKDIYYLHDMIDNVERRISQDLSISCTIHMDPIMTDDENVKEMKDFLLETMREVGLDLSIHDFRIVVGNTHTNMIFDVVLPFDHDLSEDQLKKKICDAVSKKRDNCYCVITVDRG